MIDFFNISFVDRSTYSKIETGSYIPSITTLIDVCNVLGIENILKDIK